MRKSIFCGLILSGLLCLAAAAQAQCKADLAATPANCSAPDAVVLASNLPSAPMPADTTAARPANPAPEALPMVAIVQRPPQQRDISDREQHVWRGLVVASHSAGVFDAWSTRNSLSQGRGYERNPLMRPFAGNASIYAATQAAPVGLDFLSRHMLRSNSPVVRKF